MVPAKLLIRTYFRRKIGALSDLVEPLFVDIVECEENESVTIVVAGLYNRVNTLLVSSSVWGKMEALIQIQRTRLKKDQFTWHGGSTWSSWYRHSKDNFKRLILNQINKF